MFPYTDYEFYSTKTTGKAEQGVFDAEALEASFFLRHLTLGKSDNVQPEELQYATCAIVDMYISEKSKASSGKGKKKSETTDGYSVSYATETKDGELLDELLNRKAAEIARKYLACTGLLNRKVGCNHADKFGLYDL